MIFYLFFCDWISKPCWNAYFLISEISKKAFACLFWSISCSFFNKSLNRCCMLILKVPMKFLSSGWNTESLCLEQAWIVDEQVFSKCSLSDLHYCPIAFSFSDLAIDINSPMTEIKSLLIEIFPLLDPYNSKAKAI